jgi:hypothetical protein
MITLDSVKLADNKTINGGSESLAGKTEQAVDIGLALPPAATELETSFSGTLLPADTKTIAPTTQDKATLPGKDAAPGKPEAKKSVSSTNEAIMPNEVAEKSVPNENTTFKTDSVGQEAVSEIKAETQADPAVGKKPVSAVITTMQTESIFGKFVQPLEAKALIAGEPETAAHPATRALADNIAETMLKAAEASTEEKSGQVLVEREKIKDKLAESVVDALESASANAEAEDAKPMKKMREKPTGDVAELVIQDSLFGSDVAATEAASSETISRERDARIQGEQAARSSASGKVDFKTISALWSEVAMAHSSGGADLQDAGGQMSKLTSLLSASHSALASLFQSFPDKAPDEFWTFWDQIRSLQARILEGMSDASQNQTRKQALDHSRDAAQRNGGFVIAPVVRAGRAGQASDLARFAGGSNLAGRQGALQGGGVGFTRQNP